MLNFVCGEIGTVKCFHYSRLLGMQAQRDPRGDNRSNLPIGTEWCLSTTLISEKRGSPLVRVLFRTVASTDRWKPWRPQACWRNRLSRGRQAVGSVWDSTPGDSVILNPRKSTGKSRDSCSGNAHGRVGVCGIRRRSEIAKDDDDYLPRDTWQIMRRCEKTSDLIRFHGVLPLGEVNVLLVLFRCLQLLFVLRNEEIVSESHHRLRREDCRERTAVNRFRMALVFFGRRSRGRYFFFL